MRRVFVGDIQGCRAELERLLEAVRFDPARDRLEPVGDLVNRGPDSLGVLRLLRTLDAGGVLGNHDLHLLRCAAGRRTAGPRDTFADVLEAPEREELLAWLAARPFVRCWDDVWLVHAALHPRWSDPRRELAGLDPLESDARSDFATRVRYCAADGARPASDWPPPPPPFVPWYEHWLARAKTDAPTLVFGHWARAGLVVRPGLRALDSGCVWGRELTAWIAEEDRIVQVAAARAYSEPFAD
jgi:bis(5'-nucleosyl)-tetraphosphatase (symmetrical)